MGGVAADNWNVLSHAEKEDVMDEMEYMFPDGIDLEELNDTIAHGDLLDESSSYRESYRRNLKRRVSALESRVRSSKIRRR